MVWNYWKRLRSATTIYHLLGARYVNFFFTNAYIFWPYSDSRIYYLDFIFRCLQKRRASGEFHDTLVTGVKYYRVSISTSLDCPSHFADSLGLLGEQLSCYLSSVWALDAAFNSQQPATCVVLIHNKSIYVSSLSDHIYVLPQCGL